MFHKWVNQSNLLFCLCFLYSVLPPQPHVVSLAQPPPLLPGMYSETSLDQFSQEPEFTLDQPLFAKINVTLFAQELITNFGSQFSGQQIFTSVPPPTLMQPPPLQAGLMPPPPMQGNSINRQDSLVLVLFLLKKHFWPFSL